MVLNGDLLTKGSFFLIINIRILPSQLSTNDNSHSERKLRVFVIKIYVLLSTKIISRRRQASVDWVFGAQQVFNSV